MNLNVCQSEETTGSGPGLVVWLEDSMLMCKKPRIGSVAPHKLGVVVHGFKTSTREVEAGRLGVQGGHLRPSLCYGKLCLNKQKSSMNYLHVCKELSELWNLKTMYFTRSLQCFQHSKDEQALVDRRLELASFCQNHHVMQISSLNSSSFVN